VIFDVAEIPNGLKGRKKDSSGRQPGELTADE
jgi:hypothetical protein